METSVTVKQQKAIRQIEQLYDEIENVDEVRRFLERDTFLVDILQEAPARVREFFGDVPIGLTIHHDPEEGWDELFIVIKSPYSPHETLMRDEALFREWFAYRLGGAQGKLNITEELM
ncbi:MAG: hypothetical protein HPY54_00940 [Chthonomonadetes bacterium]|nr:hypothetical protein [Chthonomonadetes bacterium]